VRSNRWIQGIFYGLTAAVLALVVSAVKRIGSKALKTPTMWGLAVAAFVGDLRSENLLRVHHPVLAAGLIGYYRAAKRFPPAVPGVARGMARPVPPKPPAWCCLPRRSASVGPDPRGWPRFVCRSGGCPTLSVGHLAGVAAACRFRRASFFSKAALVTFGGAYAVLPYVAQMTVEHHGWLSQKDMMAGLGLAETTPRTAHHGTAIRWLRGRLAKPRLPQPARLRAPWARSITTWVTFLPCFLFVFLGAPHVEGLRSRPGLSSALTAITAAVVGVILNLAIWFAWHTLRLGRRSGSTCSPPSSPSPPGWRWSVSRSA
jgi:chromate transporter